MNRIKMMIPPLPWHQPRCRSGAGDRVVLLHGLWRSVWAMEEPATFLNERGFETVNIPYPSFRKSMAEIVDQVAEAVGSSHKPTHFVTHSMGGIVVRHLAARYPELVTGRIVMLAPPNQGSEIIDWLQDSPLGRWSLGPGGMSLATGKVPVEVPGFDTGREVSVIMGRKNLVPAFDFLLKGENDGVVTVEGGKVSGLTRLEVVEADHTFIMGENRVLELLAEMLP
ncbi:MAG: triacylglycerol lipase [Akkermansiaceae bacterium]|jgi:triacylglycerol lipase